MSGGEVTIFYDFSSPFAYLASTQIERIAARHGATVVFSPMLLGGIFKQIGTPIVPLQTFPDAKRRYYGRDLHRWADYWQVPFAWPTRFPMRTLSALRLTLAVSDEQVAPLTHAIFRAYWVDDQDLADPADLAALLAEVGADAATLGRIEEPPIKQALIAATDRAVAAGVCGAPSFLVRGHLFWGQDRLELVDKTLAGWDP